MYFCNAVTEIIAWKLPVFFHFLTNFFVNLLKFGLNIKNTKKAATSDISRKLELKKLDFID
jgi:hypothetical protein